MAIDAALGRLGIKPGVCTSSTRPANPFEGQVIYETDTNNIRFWSGSAWESNKGGIISSSAPTGAAAGDIWYDSDDGRTYIYYDDGSSQQWVEFGAPPVQHGKILQVVSTTKTDTFSESLAAFAVSTSNITGLTVSITPSSATSKVLVIVELNSASSGSPIVSGQMFRDSTAIGIGDTAGSRVSVSGHLQAASGLNAQARASMTFLDSPATTSSITYGFRNYNPSSSTATIYVNRSQGDSDTAQYARSMSTITVMEVSA